MAFSTDRFSLYANLDRGSPDRFLLAGEDADESGMVTCYVYVQQRHLGSLYVAVGRTARYQLSVLRSTKRFVPVARPYVIRRDDKHEISFG